MIPAHERAKICTTWGGFHRDVPLAQRIAIVNEDNDRESADEDDIQSCWEFIGAFNASYNSRVDLDVINVLRGIRDGLYNTDIAAKYEMAPSHVEFIQYQICDSSLDLVDYGTSPRGCFDNTEGALSEFITMFEAEFARSWGGQS